MVLVPFLLPPYFSAAAIGFTRRPVDSPGSLIWVWFGFGVVPSLLRQMGLVDY